MLNKFKNIFIALTLFCFSFGLYGNQTDFLKTVDFYSKMKSKQKKKKERKKNYSYSTKQNFSSSKKSGNSKSFNAEIPNEDFQNLEYDMDLVDLEIYSKLVNSKFGYNLSLQNQKLLNALKEIYFSNNSDETALFTEGCDIKNIMDTFSDLEKLNSIISLLYLGDITTAEITANNIGSIDLKNIGLEIIFNNYIQKKDLQNAQRIVSLMIFEKEEEEDDDDYDYEKADYLQTLILAYLQNKDFGSAEKITQTLPDNEKNDAFVHIVKYYTKVNDTKNANRILDKISDSFDKDRAKIYLLDLYARQKNIVEFQKLAISSDKSELLQSSKFILAIYENNLQEVIQNQPYDYRPCDFDLIINNFVELLCSSNQIKQAEQLINTFSDDGIEKEDYSMFLINAYLKNGNFEEAKRIRNDMENDMEYDLLDKWLASKLISIYSTK